jgi:hypothetical protein
MSASKSKGMEGGFEGSVNPSSPSNQSCLFGSTRKRAPNTSLSQIKGSTVPHCEWAYLHHVTYCSWCVIGRSDVQRTFRIEDSDSITTNIPFIAARIASPTTTAEEITEIARTVQLNLNSDHLALIRVRSKTRRVGEKRQTAKI